MNPVALPAADLRALYALIGRNIAGTDAGPNEGATGSGRNPGVRTGPAVPAAPGGGEERPVLPDARKAAADGRQASPVAGSLLGLRAPGTPSLSSANRMALAGSANQANGGEETSPRAASETGDDAKSLGTPSISTQAGRASRLPEAGPFAATGNVRQTGAGRAVSIAPQADAGFEAGGDGAFASDAGSGAGLQTGSAARAPLAEGSATTAGNGLPPGMDGSGTTDSAPAFTGMAAGDPPSGAGNAGGFGQPVSPDGADIADLFGLRAASVASVDPSPLGAASLPASSMDADAPLFAALFEPRREETGVDRFGDAARTHAGSDADAATAGDAFIAPRPGAAKDCAAAAQAALATLGFAALDGFPAFAADAAMPMQAERAGVIASFILNAAMIPGWPPPRAIEGAAPHQAFAKAMSSAPLTPGETEMLMFLAHLIRNPALVERLMRLSERMLRRSRILAAFAMLFTGLKELVEVVKEELQSLEEDLEDGEVLFDGGGRRHLVLG